MKTVALLILALVGSIATRASEGGSYKAESQALSEIFTSAITKVFSARDGDYRFVAYSVVWRNQEVIVTPYNPRHADLAVGDTVRCEMRQIHPSAASGSKGRMSFSLIGRPGERAEFSILPTVGDELARMEAVAAEVARRRADREAAVSRIEVTPQKPNKAPEPTPTSVTPPAAQDARRP